MTEQEQTAANTFDLARGEPPGSPDSQFSDSPCGASARISARRAAAGSPSGSAAIAAAGSP